MSYYTDNRNLADGGSDSRRMGDRVSGNDAGKVQNTGNEHGGNGVQGKPGEIQCNRKNVCLLLSALVLGILFDVLFNGKPLGVSYPIFVVAFYGIFKLNLRDRLKVKPDFGWALSVPVLLLSLTYLLFSNEIFRVLNFLAIPVLVVLQTTLVSDSARYEWYTPGVLYDLIIGFVYRPLAFVGKPFALVSKLIRSKMKGDRYNTLGKVLIGILVSVPILLVTIPLLTSADIVFESFLGEIPELLRKIALDRYISHIFVALVIALLAFSYMWSMLYQKNNIVGFDWIGDVGVSAGPDTAVPGVSGEGAPGADGRNGKPEGGYMKKWDPVITVTVFCVINLIYLLFTFIQFSYLFGSLSIGLPEGFTYSEYARRGFFELVAVTVINFSLLLVFLHGTGKGAGTVNMAARVLFSLLVFNTGVMLFSAHFRMSLYEEAYGYTYLRLLTHAFMVFLLVLFIITLYRIWRESVRLLRPYIITAIAAFVIINYINIDVIIARNNINRYYDTGKIDMHYLSRLSWDAVPELVKLMENGDEKVSRVTEDCLYRKKEGLDRSEPWQSFNLSKYRAKKLLSKYELEYHGESTEGLDGYMEDFD